MPRRRAMLAAPALLATPAAAQQRPLRIITPFAAGGATDTLARIVGGRITALTGQAVVVEPRPGAGGDLAMQAGAAAEPDGHTLILGSDSSMVRNPMLRRGIPYDPERDFAPVARLVVSWYAIAVNAALPVRSLAEFVAWARANPGRANYGSAGPGTLAHVIGEMMSPTCSTCPIAAPTRRCRTWWRGGCSSTRSRPAGCSTCCARAACACWP